MEACIFEVNAEVVEPCVYCCSAQQQANVGGRERVHSLVQMRACEVIILPRWRR